MGTKTVPNTWLIPTYDMVRNGYYVKYLWLYYQQAVQIRAKLWEFDMTIHSYLWIDKNNSIVEEHDIGTETHLFGFVQLSHWPERQLDL